MQAQPTAPISTSRGDSTFSGKKKRNEDSGIGYVIETAAQAHFIFRYVYVKCTLLHLYTLLVAFTLDDCIYMVHVAEKVHF